MANIMSTDTSKRMAPMSSLITTQIPITPRETTTPRSRILSAFSTADPARGMGYAGAVASQAQSDCLAGRPVRTEPKPINTTCTRNGVTTNCVTQ